jgi:hypothetical protein
MSNLWKTEADLRAEKAKAAGAAAAKFDTARKAELDALLKRLAAIAAVFQMRADAVPVPPFRRIRELMDIYIAAGLRGIHEGKDFIDQGVHLSDQEMADVHKLMRDIFAIDVAGPDTGKPERK